MNKKRALLVLFILLVPFLLVLFSYKIVFVFTGYTLEQQKVMAFLNSGKEISADATAAEILHLEDVKEMMKKADYSFYVLLLSCTLIITYIYKDKRYLSKLLLYGGIAASSLVVLFFIFALINFDFLFNLFHQIFFPQGNWVFSADSYLIRTFPRAFFISLARKIISLSLILASIFIGGSIYLKYANKN